jgi:hypothetical protein
MPLLPSLASGRADADPLRITQLSFSATRWKHGYQNCFATFISRKITKLLMTQQPLKLEDKISTDLESLEFLEFFVASVIKLKNTQ